MSPTLKSTGGWVTLCPNLGVFPLEQTNHVGVAKSEHPRLTNGEIIFEEFQPMWSQSTNVTDMQTDGRTDRQTCDRNTALCTKVHRAVKSSLWDHKDLPMHYILQKHVTLCSTGISTKKSTFYWKFYESNMIIITYNNLNYIICVVFIWTSHYRVNLV